MLRQSDENLNFVSWGKGILVPMPPVQRFGRPFPVQSAPKRRGKRGAFASDVQPFPGALQLLAFPLSIASYALGMSVAAQDVAEGCTPAVQFALCTPKKNRRNSAPIIIKSPAVDFSRKDKHPNFMSLSAKFPESPSPESPTSPLMCEKRVQRPKLSRLSQTSNKDVPRSPKSPNYRSPKSPNQTPRSPSSNNYFKFPPLDRKQKMCQDSIDEYKVYESFGSMGGYSSPGDATSRNRGSVSSCNSGRPASPINMVHSSRNRSTTSSVSSVQPMSPTNINYEGFRSRSGSSSGSQPRSSISSSTTHGRSDISSFMESSMDSPVTCSTRCRRSTSDLTDLAEEGITEATSLTRPCSPRSRSGSVKGGLAYLASRRGSRESILSNVSNASNEDIGPLNFTACARGRQRRTSNFLELPVPDHVRPRVCSLPEKPFNPRSGEDLYRLRAFSINTKGAVVNCGDSIITRRSRSNTSVNSLGTRNSGLSGGERSPFDGSCCGSSYNNVSTSEAEEEEVTKYRVVLLGDSGVGKSALVSQFMTSEYMNTYDASLDDEFGEKTVSVLLDGEESEMIFIDHPAAEMSAENCLATYEPHACVVIYSVVDRVTFQVAEDILNYLWRENYTREKSVILVGNKADLARARVIPTAEGKAAAASRDCKFIETSSGIQHNVDELLVGILKQCRLKETRDKKEKRKNGKFARLHGSRTSLSLNVARELLQRICLNDSKSKSCENLHVL